MAMPDGKIGDVQRTEDYQLTGLKNVDHNNDIQLLKTSSINSGLSNSRHEEPDDYSTDVIEEVEAEEGDEMFMLRLISAVKLYPAIYDPNFQPQLPRHVVKKHKADAWVRIRLELAWNGGSSIECIWNDLLDQYTRRITMKLEDNDSMLSSRVMSSIQWIDQFITHRIKSTPLPTRANSVSNSIVQQSGIEKDTFYADMPQNITEDVMISGCRPVVSHSAPEYVVVQPQRTRHSSHQPQTSASSSQLIQQTIPRNYSTPQHPTNPEVQLRNASLEAAQSNRRNVAQSQNMQQYSPKRVVPEGQILQVIKKDDNNSGTMTMMVDMTTYYQNGSGQKMYRLLSVPPGSQQPAVQLALPNQISSSQQQQQHNERKFDIQRTGNPNIVYDLPPEPLIEGSPNIPHDQPPRKKIAFEPHRSVSNPTAPTGSNTVMMPINRIEDTTIMTGRVQISGDQIIDDGIQESTIVIDPDGHLHEESPLLSASPDVMISGQSARGHHPQIPIPSGIDQRMPPVNSQIPSVSNSAIHHQHHHQHHQQQQNIVRRGRTPVDEVDHGDVENATDDMGNPHQTQYDADLQFQQLISSHLSRLNDDDKAIMKYNMQRILLDARFGEGTAKQLLAEEDILDNEPVHGDLEPAPIVAEEAQIQ